MHRFRTVLVAMASSLSVIWYGSVAVAQKLPAKTPVVTRIPQPSPAPKPSPDGRSLSPEQMGATMSGTIRLSKHPEASAILSEVANAFDGVSINVGLLSGEKYEAGSCVGIKVSSGTFELQMTKPQFSVDNTGVVFAFTIPHVTLNALRLHAMPSAHANPCSYGGVLDVGGSASDVRFTYRLDPILALSNCSMFRLDPSLDEAKWSIGGLNLKPLQNDLDKVAKRMLVASLKMMSGNAIGLLFAKRVENALKLHPKCIG